MPKRKRKLLLYAEQIMKPRQSEAKGTTIVPFEPVN